MSARIHYHKHNGTSGKWNNKSQLIINSDVNHVFYHDKKHDMTVIHNILNVQKRKVFSKAFVLCYDNKFIDINEILTNHFINQYQFEIDGIKVISLRDLFHEVIPNYDFRQYMERSEDSTLGILLTKKIPNCEDLDISLTLNINDVTKVKSTLANWVRQCKKADSLLTTDKCINNYIEFSKLMAASNKTLQPKITKSSISASTQLLYKYDFNKIRYDLNEINFGRDKRNYENIKQALNKVTNINQVIFNSCGIKISSISNGLMCNIFNGNYNITKNSFLDTILIILDSINMLPKLELSIERAILQNI